MKLNIGETIKKLRKERDITQEELAEILGVTCQSVSRWEKNSCYPDIELIPTIASFFNISTDKLMGVDEAAEKKAVEQYLNGGGDPWFKDICKKAKEENPELDIPHRLILFPMVQEGVLMINGGMSAYGYDGTCGEDRTKLTVWGRQRAQLVADVLFKKYMPGGKNSRLRLTAYYPGVRETRRIVGETTLTEEMILDDSCPDEVIAIAGRHFDLSRQQKNAMFDNVAHQALGERELPHGATGIPYGAMVPKNSENIFVAGRCIAADGQALGPARIMSTCMAVGEAAGVAASMMIDDNMNSMDVDVQQLRNNLREKGAIVDL